MSWLRDTAGVDTQGPGIFVAAVKGALDELMVERGFASGQGGDDSSLPVNVIYCAGLAGFRERWPSVFAAINSRFGEELGERVTCIDLTVTGSSADGVMDVRLEDVSLEELSSDATDSVLVEEVDRAASADAAR